MIPPFRRPPIVFLLIDLLRRLAVLKTPVDAFFESVMVNAEDPKLRRNRHALLKRLYGAMNRVAELARAQ